MKSEFRAMIGDVEGHTVQMEFVPNAQKPTAIYIVADGKRIAYRANRKWVSLGIPGYGVSSIITHRSTEVH